MRTGLNVPIRRQLRLIALACGILPQLARGAPVPEPFIEDRTLASGVRVVLAPLASAPVEIRAWGGACAPCVDGDLARVAERLAARPSAPPPEQKRDPMDRARSLAEGRGRARPLVVIAGGFALDETRAAVEERLGKLARAEELPPRREIERALRVPADRARLYVAYRAAAPGAVDAWAAVLAERVAAARLKRRGVGSDARLEWIDGAQLALFALADADERALLDEEWQRLAREPPAARELDDARKSLPPASRVERLAELTRAVGNPRLVRDDADDLQRVAGADVSRAAARFADRAHRATVETFVAAEPAAALPAGRGAPKVPKP
jgi:hypothetical protein